jgi:hypothetical protein
LGLKAVEDSPRLYRCLSLLCKHQSELIEAYRRLSTADWRSAKHKLMTTLCKL